MRMKFCEENSKRNIKKKKKKKKEKKKTTRIKTLKHLEKLELKVSNLRFENRILSY